MTRSGPRLPAATGRPKPASGGGSGPLVEARDLFKIYREGAVETVALRGANLALPRGAVTSLVGPSGSGKSSLIAILAGLSLPSAGQVLFDGEDLTRSDEAGRARLRASAATKFVPTNSANHLNASIEPSSQTTGLFCR